jgi:hypothetical protein
MQARDAQPGMGGCSTPGRDFCESPQHKRTRVFSGLVICDLVRPGFRCPCRARAPGSGRPSVHHREVHADRVGSHGRLVSAGQAAPGIPYLASRVAVGPGEPAAGHAFAWALPVSAPFVEDSPWARRAAAPCPERPTCCAVASACPFPNHASCAPYRRAQRARDSIRVLSSGDPGSRSSIRGARFCRRAEAPDDRSPRGLKSVRPRDRMPKPDAGAGCRNRMPATATATTTTFGSSRGIRY